MGACGSYVNRVQRAMFELFKSVKLKIRIFEVQRTSRTAQRRKNEVEMAEPHNAPGDVALPSAVRSEVAGQQLAVIVLFSNLYIL